jgi:hypothetical protein
MKRRENGNPDQKAPDLAAYRTDGDVSFLNAKRKQRGHPADQTDCLIVGDFKLAAKFDRSLLFARGRSGKFHDRGQKVMNQIHDYMDMHHNRYGYIISEKELIMFRRRTSPMEVWGHLDYSPSIPVSTDKGKLNAMMVLWYFHVKYAVLELDGGWRLPSTYHNCPEGLQGTSVIPKELKKMKSGCLKKKE